MDLMLLRVFQGQIALQADFFSIAAKQLDDAMAKQDVDGVFYALQNMLNASANIAKALWGSRGKAAEARKDLRDSIGVTDNSPLKEVEMRNNFEHFDERLELWWKQSAARNFVDKNVGDFAGFAEIDRFRNYNPSTGEVTFWGQNFNIRQLRDEVSRIGRKAQEENKPDWH